MTKKEKHWVLGALWGIDKFLHTQDINDLGRATACLLNALPKEEAKLLHKQLADGLNGRPN